MKKLFLKVLILHLFFSIVIGLFLAPILASALAGDPKLRVLAWICGTSTTLLLFPLVLLEFKFQFYGHFNIFGIALNSALVAILWTYIWSKLHKIDPTESAQPSAAADAASNGPRG